MNRSRFLWAAPRLLTHKVFGGCEAVKMRQSSTVSEMERSCKKDAPISVHLECALSVYQYSADKFEKLLIDSSGSLLLTEVT